VERVVDGDTVRIKGVKAPVRLYGIDAPEMTQNGGPAARLFLRGLTEGKPLSMEDTGKDCFGRGTVKIWADGKYVNLEMVRAGHAWWYNSFAPDDNDLARAELDARRSHRGLWAAPEEPAAFRKEALNRRRAPADPDERTR
jgi:micrococcal nuclease